MTRPELEIPLAELVRALRRQLLTAVAEGEDEPLRFALGPIELELQVEITREAEGEAGIRFWVVSFGGKGSRSSATTHTIRLSLTPSDGTPGPVVVGASEDRRPD